MKRSFHDFFMKANKNHHPKSTDKSQPEARFQDENLSLQSFSRHFLVQCPQCQKMAEVKSEENGAAKLACRHCGLVKSNNPLRYRMQMKRNCPKCGELFQLDLVDNLEKKEEKVKVTCSNCRDVQVYEPKYMEYRVLSQSFGEGKDGYFGCELWLQTDFRGNVLWANNREHLDYLKRYIQARLRERNDRQGFTLVEKLPQFIKSAKNREALLKEIEKLEKKI